MDRTYYEPPLRDTGFKPLPADIGRDFVNSLAVALAEAQSSPPAQSPDSGSFAAEDRTALNWIHSLGRQGEINLTVQTEVTRTRDDCRELRAGGQICTPRPPAGKGWFRDRSYSGDYKSRWLRVRVTVAGKPSHREG
jgi:hypothetical protein